MYRVCGELRMLQWWLQLAWLLPRVAECNSQLAALSALPSVSLDPRSFHPEARPGQWNEDEDHLAQVGDAEFLSQRLELGCGWLGGGCASVAAVSAEALREHMYVAAHDSITHRDILVPFNPNPRR